MGGNLKKNINSNQFSRYPFLISKFKEIYENSKINRQNYIWGGLCGIDLANFLGIKKVSFIEFGVAGGNGLVCLEKISKEIEKIYGIKIEVFGFDTGKGLPKPTDYRDLPQLWDEGYFPMDLNKLKKRLTKAKLILGDVKNTVMEFINSNPSPIAFISFDLDLYSSTMDSFKIFEADEKILLPRIHCYFDDIMGYSYGDFNGERLAINEFNNKHDLRKISKIYGLKYYLHEDKKWMEQIFMMHAFDHKLYLKNDGMLQANQLSLD